MQTRISPDLGAFAGASKRDPVAVIRAALSEARRLLAEHVEPGGPTCERTISRLLGILDGPEVRHALTAKIRAVGYEGSRAAEYKLDDEGAGTQRQISSERRTRIGEAGMITTKDAQYRWGISKTTVFKLIRSGRVETTMERGQRLVDIHTMREALGLVRADLREALS